MKKVKIGQIGIGHNHGQGKMQAVRHFPELFEAVGVCEPSEQWRRQRGALPEYAGLPYMSEEELLEKCDAVLVETEVPQLTQTAARCIDAGRPIHMDKPAGTDYAAYKRMLNAARDKGLAVQLGYMYRYNPAVKKCLELLDAGALGEITSVNAEMSTNHPTAYRTWLEQFPGGSMYIFGCHLIDLTVRMLGEPCGVYPFNKCTGKEGTRSWDNGFAVLDYAKAVAKITNNSTEINGWGRRQLVVCGTRGTVEIKPLEVPTVMTFADAASTDNDYADRKTVLEIPSVPNRQRYDEMMRDFYAFVTGEKENPYSVEHELAVQRTLLAACGVRV